MTPVIVIVCTGGSEDTPALGQKKQNLVNPL